jgi:NAD-dependent deacetylase
MPFEELSSARMVRINLPLVWEWFDYRRGVIQSCEPNDAHRAISAAAESGRFETFAIVTQNIDGLHLAAGSKEVVELHGNIHRARCLSCRHIRDLGEISADERPPACPLCYDSMRPDVVLFGEYLSAENINRARKAAEQCDACLVVGTSAVVYPANELPIIAKRGGAFVIEVNPEETPLTPACDIPLHGPASQILPNILL